jgi:hypothetical protein
MSSPLPLTHLVDGIPISFQEVGGGTFLIPHGRKSSDEQLASAIRRSCGVVAQAEEDANRFFVVADFFDVYRPTQRYTEEDLVAVARAYAARLKLLLRAAFPSRQFAVDIVGDHLVDEEPLELCVTFKTEI